MEFGVWKYMFANPQYRAVGRTLLAIFPNKPRSSAEVQYNKTTPISSMSWTESTFFVTALHITSLSALHVTNLRLVHPIY
ncbi:MAG: hypothetical protein K2J94_02675, partial [Duncaniella sp.]|nr:hypothetical protein [Duncaniella sp.]